MKVTEAVKTLRLHLGDTQQSFATRLGLAISTAVRYESTRAPRGRALAQLYDVAKQHGCDAAAQVFHGALAKEMGGIPVPHTFSLPAGISPEEIHPQTSDEARLETLDALKPATIRPTEGSDYLYLLMPVRVS